MCFEVAGKITRGKGEREVFPLDPYYNIFIGLKNLSLFAVSTKLHISFFMELDFIFADFQSNAILRELNISFTSLIFDKSLIFFL